MPYMTNIPIPPCDLSQIENNANSENIYWKGEYSHPNTYFNLGVKKNFVSSNYLLPLSLVLPEGNFRSSTQGYFSKLEKAYTYFKTLADRKNLSYGVIQSENFGSNSTVDFALQSLTRYFSKSNFPQKFQTLKDTPNAGDNALFLFEEYANRLCYLGNPMDEENDWTNAQQAVRVWLDETDVLGLSNQLEQYNLPKTLFNILYFSGNQFVRRGIEDLLNYGGSTSVRWTKEIAINQSRNLFAKTTHVLNILFMLDYLGEQRLGDSYLNTPTIIGLEVMNFSYLSWMKDKILDTVGVRIERERYQPIQESDWLTTPEEWEKDLKSQLQTIGVKSPETINLLIKVYDKGGNLTQEDFEGTVLRYLKDRNIPSMLDTVETMLRVKFQNEIPTNIDTVLKLGYSKDQLTDFIINSLKVTYLNDNQNQNISGEVSKEKPSRNYILFGIIAGLGLTYYLVRRNSPN